MLENRKKWLAASVLSVSLLLTACQQPTAVVSVDPQKAVQESLTKSAEITSYTMKGKITVDLKGPEGQPPAKVTANLDLDGGLDLKDIADPKVNLKVNGDMGADADSAKINAEVKINKEAIFVIVNALEGAGQFSIPEEMKNQVVAKWWKLPIPPEYFQDLMKNLPQGGKTADLTPEQMKIRETFQNTVFFKDVKAAGEDTVMGTASNRYTATLDKNAVVNFVTEIAKTQGGTVTDAEIAEMRTALENVDINVDLYIAKDSGIMNRAVANIQVKSTDGTAPSGPIKVDFAIGNINQPVTVEAPANAEVLPLNF